MTTGDAERFINEARITYIFDKTDAFLAIRNRRVPTESSCARSRSVCALALEVRFVVSPVCSLPKDSFSHSEWGQTSLEVASEALF